MSVRIRYKLEIAISSSSNEEKDLANYKTESFCDFLTEGSSIKIIVPKNVEDMQLNLPNFDEINFVTIVTYSNDPTLVPVTIDLKKNSNGGEVISIVPLGPTASTPKQGILVLSTENLNELFATNASTTTDMVLTLFLAGSIG